MSWCWVVGWRVSAEHAYPLYSEADAERLRQHLQYLLQDAISRAGPGEPGALDVVVVGGGPTGVETAGALAELMQALSSTGRLAEPGQITILDRGSVLLWASSLRGLASTPTGS